MDFKIYRYSFPFNKPFKTSTATFNVREGIILEITDGKNNITALGEAAPLSGFSVESLQEVIEQLETHFNAAKKLFQDRPDLDTLQVFYRKQEIFPSLQFAFDTLAVDYLSQKQHIPAHKFLFDDPTESLEANAVISIGDHSGTLETVKQVTGKGYKTIKMKVGEDFNREFTVIQEIRKSYPSLSIRLDANKAWSLDEAINNLAELDDLDIEYCEEPLLEASAENLKKIKDSVTTPVALDESLLAIKNLSATLPFVPVVVIKPMVYGSLSKLFATNRLVNTHGNKVIYTTSLESGIGRSMTVTLAAGLGSRNTAHGLSTGSLLKMDVWNDGTYINFGSVSLPNRFELGKRYHSNHKYLEPVLIDL